MAWRALTFIGYNLSGRALCIGNEFEIEWYCFESSSNGDHGEGVPSYKGLFWCLKNSFRQIKLLYPSFKSYISIYLYISDVHIRIAKTWSMRCRILSKSMLFYNNKQTSKRRLTSERDGVNVRDHEQERAVCKAVLSIYSPLLHYYLF